MKKEQLYFILYLNRTHHKGMTCPPIFCLSMHDVGTEWQFAIARLSCCYSERGERAPAIQTSNLSFLIILIGLKLEI